MLVDLLINCAVWCNWLHVFAPLRITKYMYGHCYHCADKYAHPVGSLCQSKWGHVSLPNAMSIKLYKKHPLSITSACLCACVHGLAVNYSANFYMPQCFCLSWLACAGSLSPSSLCRQICLSQNRTKKSLGLNIAHMHLKNSQNIITDWDSNGKNIHKYWKEIKKEHYNIRNVAL